jgi:hypothetical protein
MRITPVVLWVILTAALTGCSREPDRLVRATTSDGAFELSLEAAEDWLRPGSSLPVRVRLESLSGRLSDAFYGDIELIVSNGSVMPRSVSVALPGPDGTAAEAATVFQEWVTFTAPSYVSDDTQSELYAVFRDTQIVLRLRVTPRAD